MNRPGSKITSHRSHVPSAIGWHGIYLEPPSGWDLAQVSGDMVQGQIRVDGPTNQHIRVRWKREKRKPNIDRILDRYLKDLEKASRKKKTAFERSVDLNLPVHTEKGKRKPVFFSWRSKEQAIGLIWWCEICKRITIAQVDGPLERNLTPVAIQILGTLDDHAVDGVHTWAAYGLSVEIPDDFTLMSSKLLSGYIDIRFTRRRSSIVVDRWGLADVALRSQNLKDWILAHYQRTLEKYRYEVRESIVRGHPGIEITGAVKGIRERMRAAALGQIRLEAASQLTQYAWQCPDTNRICTVVVLHTASEPGLAEEVAASFACHTM